MKMTMKNNSSQRFIIVLGVIAAICEIGLCIEESMGNLGGLRGYVSQNSGEIDSVARFAVEEHNKKQKKNSLLEFSRVVDAKEQVVAGKLYHLTLEAYEGGTKNTYEAKVWIKPWMNFKQLQEFKPSPSRGEGN